MELQQASGFTGVMSAPVLAAGTTSTISTSTAIVYAIDGKAYTQAAYTNQATPTTDAFTGAAFVAVTAGYGCVFYHCLNAAKTLGVVQSEIVALDAGGNFISAPKIPAMPVGYIPFGYLVYKSAAGGAAFTYGTSNQAGVTGGTYTRGDLASLPSRPIIA